MLGLSPRRSLRYALLAVACAACSSATSPPAPTGASLENTDARLTGCKGKASSSIPSDGVYVITTFGGPSESQKMSCGSHTKSGSWYYAASRQRYGCGTHVRIEANGKCVVAKTDDYGPDVCVENAAHRPIMDVSPLVAKHLFGVSGMGWSDAKLVTVSVASSADPLGPCTQSSGSGDPGGSGSGDPGSGGGAQCYCDAECTQYGDCCASCNQGSGGSSGAGSGGSGSASASCYCDAECTQYGDCCASCNQGSGGSSGTGAGGTGSGGGNAACYCDAECTSYGDCCTDCSGGSSGGQACYCDASCVQYGDCCASCP